MRLLFASLAALSLGLIPGISTANLESQENSSAQLATAEEKMDHIPVGSDSNYASSLNQEVSLTFDPTSPIVDSGLSGTVPWRINTLGELIFDAGSFAKYTTPASTNSVWGSYSADVTAIYFTDPTNTAFGTETGHMFANMPNLKDIVGIDQVDTSSVTNTNAMFYNDWALENLQVNSWDTSNIVDMNSMFYGTSSLQELDLSGWDVSKVEFFGSMFNRNTSMISLDVSTWNVSSANFMGFMFSNMSALKQLDLSGWDTTSEPYMNDMFSGTQDLEQLSLGANTVLSNKTKLYEPTQDSVNTGKWAAVGSGTASFPTGGWAGSSADLASHSGSKAETYVLQKAVTIIFDSGSSPTSMPQIEAGTGEEITLPAGIMVWNGYEFVGWNAAPDNTGTSYVDGDSAFFPSGTTTLYAQWKKEATPSPTPTTTTKPAPTPALSVQRIGGSDRYATSRELNKLNTETGKPVFVTTGLLYPDALSAGPAVSLTNGSLFLSRPNILDSNTYNQISSKKPSIIYVIGGKSAISTSVENRLRNIAKVERISGGNRFDTSEAIFTKFFAGRTDVTEAFIATGWLYPDALSAAAAGGTLKAPVLLVNSKAGQGLSANVTSTMRRQGISTAYVVGGNVAIPKRVERGLNNSFSKVQRLSGADRYRTNQAVNNLVNAIVGTNYSDILVATGKDFPDALSAAVPAGKTSARLVLSPGDCLPSPTVSQWIKGPTSKVQNVTLIGGNNALNNQVKQLNQCR